MNKDPKMFYKILRKKNLLARVINTNITEIDITQILNSLNIATEEDISDIKMAIMRLGFKQIPLTLTSSMGIRSAGIYQINKPIEILDRENNYHQQTNNITASSSLSQPRELDSISEPAVKRARIEQLPVNQGASSSSTVDNINPTQKLFNKLAELGKITEQAIINNTKKQTNLYVTYDDVISIFKDPNISNTADTQHYLRLLGFIENTKHKYTYTIPYNINLADYKKYYLPFVVSITSKDKNYGQRISQLTKVYTGATEVKDLETLSAILHKNHTNTKNSHNKAKYKKLLEYKNTSGYVYKESLN
ncbi:hypothetical protein ACFX5K_06080 [Rickettsiales bacterium LUAb2]